MLNRDLFSNLDMDIDNDPLFMFLPLSLQHDTDYDYIPFNNLPELMYILGVILLIS